MLTHMCSSALATPIFFRIHRSDSASNIIRDKRLPSASNARCPAAAAKARCLSRATAQRCQQSEAACWTWHCLRRPNRPSFAARHDCATCSHTQCQLMVQRLLLLSAGGHSTRTPAERHIRTLASFLYPSLSLPIRCCWSHTPVALDKRNLGGVPCAVHV